MRRRDLLERGELGLGAREFLAAQQRGDEAVARRDLVVVLALGERVVEVRDRLLRRALVAPQQRAHQLEVERVGHLPVGLALRARLRLGDALVGDRVRAQVRRRVAVGEAARLLQPLHQRRHRVDVEAGGVEALEADAVGFVLVLAREVELLLDRERLRRGDRRGRGLAATTTSRSATRRSPRASAGERVQQRRSAASAIDARQVVLRDVRDFVREHRGELGFVLREQDEAGVDADEAAGQRERVDRGVGDGEELEVLRGSRGSAATSRWPSSFR